MATSDPREPAAPWPAGRTEWRDADTRPPPGLPRIDAPAIEAELGEACAYELRRALQIERAQLALLEDEAVLPPATRDALAALRATGNRIARLCDEFAALQHHPRPADVLEPAPSMVDLARLCRECAATVAPAAAAGEVALSIELPGAPPFVCADEGQLRAAIEELLLYTVTATPSGGAARLEIIAAAFDGEVRVQVGGGGPGIRPAELRALFRRSRGRAVASGPAAGLSIVREIAERHGGRLRARAKQGGGTTLVLTLPWSGPAASPRTKPTRRVLLVGGTQPDVARLATALRARGDAIESAADVVTGLRRARGEAFDLLLLEAVLPDGDGVAMLERLRRDTRTQALPIVILASPTAAETRLRALALGASDSLDWSAQPEELALRIERAVEAQAARARLEAEAERDELTGLGNFRFLTARLRLEQARARRYDTPLALVVLDVDGFKRWNDARGHAGGNELLARLGRLLHEEVRETDVAARFGGDEFVVVLPETTAPEACVFAERVRRRFAALMAGAVPSVSLSLGVAGLEGSAGPPAPERTSGDDLFREADGALYRAKQRGGNVVELAATAPAGRRPT